jgi:hypothetical protein
MWQFAEHLLDRRENLTGANGDEIIAKLVDRMEILCGHTQKCDLDPRFCRVTYCLAVDHPTFDLFFNSEQGYRGHYFRSSYLGLEYNAAVLQSLLPSLLDYQKLEPQCEVGIRDSLTSTSAKVWLAEVEKHICPQCQGEWTAPSDDMAEIINGRWDLKTEGPSRWGKKAPYLTKLRIFGAFLDAVGNELIPWDKRRRSEQIQEQGWA